MATYKVILKKLSDGTFHARYNATIVGMAESTGNSEAAALDLLPKEIRYRIEWCPCSGVAEDDINLDVQRINDRSLNHLKAYK